MEVCGKNVLVCVCVWCESVCVFVCVVRCVYESTVVRRNSPRRKQSRSSQIQHVQHLNPPEKAYLCYENHAHNDTTLLWVLFPVLVPQAFFHTGGETSFFLLLCSSSGTMNTGGGMAMSRAVYVVNGGEQF